MSFKKCIKSFNSISNEYNVITRDWKLLHLHVFFFGLLDLLPSKLEIYFTTRRKKYQKFIAHIVAYFFILTFFWSIFHK